jgi:peptidoglycan/xylan/chitin deacetylase (PgdA/CDA1 family)
MKRLRRSAFFILPLVAASVACYVFWPREPMFQERPLSEWLGELAALGPGPHAGESREPARLLWNTEYQGATAAVRSIGPSALPYLLRWLCHAPRRSPLREKVEELLDRQSWIKVRLPQREDRTELAYMGFKVLGPMAIPAVPRLSKLLVRPAYAEEAAACLQAMGPAGFPALACGLTNSDPSVRHVALVCLLHEGTQLGPAVLPVLIGAITNGICPLDEEVVRLLGDSGPVVRGLEPWLDSIVCSPTNALAGPAIRLITAASDKPQKYLPIFSEQLVATNLSRDAAFALARVGPAGVPPLLRALTNLDLRVKGAALSAIHPDFGGAMPGYPFYDPSSSFDLRCGVWTRRAGLVSRPEMEALATSGKLMTLLDNPEVPVRQQIVQLLGHCGPYGAPGLSRAAEDGDETVRAAAQAALGKLDLEVRDGAIVRGPRGKKQIALVFTGHEYAEGGQTILDELARHKARASFFLTGDFLGRQAFRPLVQRICDEGHYLGPHSGRHLLYCSWEEPKTTLVTREQFDSDIALNISEIGRWFQPTDLPGYFVPPYEHSDFHIVEWAGNHFYVTINLTRGTRASADYTGEADRNFVPSQAIFDSIIAREQQDPHGLNGFILLLHLGAGPGRTDKFHARFGELLDRLSAKGYAFVAVDTLIDPKAAEENRGRAKLSQPPVLSDTDEVFRKRYGLSR